MKRVPFVGVMLFCGLWGGMNAFAVEANDLSKEMLEIQSESFDSAVDRETETTEKGTALIQKQITKEFEGRGNAEQERKRQQRALRYSTLEASGLFAESGDTLTVTVSGQDSLGLVIGTPERNKQKKVSLNQGSNTITVENSGAVYITNPNNEGSALVTIAGATGSMPYFELSITSLEDFQNQMNNDVNATDVQLVSKKAILTVSYERAKKYLSNPRELLEYFDTFLVAQDEVSGISEAGRPVNRVDRHFQHYIEVSRMYMFATNEYMGFNGDGALERLLKTNNGWGVWHETGHQRQQAPWRWGSVIESTVNIYSMAAQRAINGSVTALDKYYPQMYAFFQQENKDFESQNNDLKMVMFGQLGNTFGADFYPVLHQYYREKELSYGSDEEKIQNFVVNVSKVTGYNMVPYFKQWGFAIVDSTVEQTKQLLELPAPIWLNDKQNNRRLPMRLLNEVAFSENEVHVSLTDYDKNVFQGQKLVLLINNKYASELNNKRAFYSSVVNNVWTTKVALKPNDEVRIETRNTDGTFQLYNSAILVNQIQSQLQEYLNSEDALETILNQNILDNFRKEIAGITNEQLKKELLSILEILEQKYLASLVRDVSIDDKGTLSVEFTNDQFKTYKKVVIVGADKPVAEVANGTAYSSSLTGNTVNVSNQKKTESYAVQFHLPHKTYTVGETNEATLVLKGQVKQLFLAENQLNSNVTQVYLDELRAQINQLSGDLKEKLTVKLDEAQQLFFEQLVSEILAKDHKLTITFSSDLFKNYKLVMLENGRYMAEVTNGKVYYGQLKGTEFSSSKSVVTGNSYDIEVRHSSGKYRIKRITVE